MVIRTGGCRIDHENGTGDRANGPFGRRPHEHVAQHLASVRSNDEKIGARLFGRARDPGERIGQHDTGLARNPVDVPDRALQILQERGRRLVIAVDLAAWLIVVDHMNDRQHGIELPGQQGRASERSVRSLGEVGGQQDLLHVILLVAGTLSARPIRPRGRGIRIDRFRVSRSNLEYPARNKTG